MANRVSKTITDQALLSELLSLKSEDVTATYIYNLFGKSSSYDEFAASLWSKNYTYARIDRVLFHIIGGITQELIANNKKLIGDNTKNKFNNIEMVNFDAEEEEIYFQITTQYQNENIIKNMSEHELRIREEWENFRVKNMTEEESNNKLEKAMYIFKMLASNND